MATLVSKIVEVYPFRFTGDHVEHLLLRRAPGDLLYPGIWQVVTGQIEPGETAIAAALREFTEETGLKPLRFWSVPQVTAFYDHHSDEVDFCALFACQVGDAVRPVLSAEHDRYRWTVSAEAAPLLVWPSQRDALAMVEQIIVGGDKAAEALRLL